MLTGLDVGTATISHRTTSIYPVGSSKEEQFRLGWWLVLPQVSLRENHTTASLRPRIPSRFSLTGSPSRAPGTVEPQYILLLGPPHRTRVFTLLNAGITWRKRCAFYRRLPLRTHAGMKQTAFMPQGEINVDQAHRGYDVTVDDTGKTWYNPF